MHPFGYSADQVFAGTAVRREPFRIPCLHMVARGLHRYPSGLLKNCVDKYGA